MCMREWKPEPWCRWTRSPHRRIVLTRCKASTDTSERPARPSCWPGLPAHTSGRAAQLRLPFRSCAGGSRIHLTCALLTISPDYTQTFCWSPRSPSADRQAISRAGGLSGSHSVYITDVLDSETFCAPRMRLCDPRPHQAGHASRCCLGPGTEAQRLALHNWEMKTMTRKTFGLLAWLVELIVTAERVLYAQHSRGGMMGMMSMMQDCPKCRR